MKRILFSTLLVFGIAGSQSALGGGGSYGGNGSNESPPAQMESMQAPSIERTRDFSVRDSEDDHFGMAPSEAGAALGGGRGGVNLTNIGHHGDSVNPTIERHMADH